MNNVFIYHHLGLGDHIICNGLVREIARAYEARGEDYNLNLFCKPHNHTSVSFMFKDLDKLQIIKADDARARLLLHKYDNGFVIGHDHLINKDPSLNFDEAFYTQLGFPFDLRWQSFKCDRDMVRELAVCMSVTEGEDKEYAFVHDDPSRNLVIDRSHIDPSLKIITPYDYKTSNIFDFMTVMQLAKEVHCMDSSFRLMYDSLIKDTSSKLFYHINLSNGVVRNPEFSKSKLPWTIV
jgi:hypothetical protein